MEKNIYESKNMHALIFTFSMPAILSLLVEIMTSVVDTVFAGHLGRESVYALTAIGFLAPLLNIYTAFQSLYAVSTSIFVARYLNDKTARNKYFSTGILFTFFVSILVSALSFWEIDPLLRLIGAKKEVFSLAASYLRIQLVSNIFSALGYTLTSCIRAFGYPKTELLLTISAVIVNVLSNIIFAFHFHLGFSGLALGTLTSEIFCMISAIVWLANKKLLPQPLNFFERKIFTRGWELFRLGFAQTIIQACSGCTGFFINHRLALCTVGNYVAIWAIVQKIYTFTLMPIVGITQGVQTIIAYYSGQAQNTKKTAVLRLTVFYTVLYGCISTFVIFLAGGKFLHFFGASAEILWKSTEVLKIVFLTFPILGIFYTILTLLEVTGHEIKAVILTLTRQLFLIVPLIQLIPALFPQQNNAVFYAIPVSDLLVLLVSFLLIRK